MTNAMEDAEPYGAGQVAVLVAERQRLPSQEDAVVVEVSELIHGDEDPPRQSRAPRLDVDLWRNGSASRPVDGNRARRTHLVATHRSDVHPGHTFLALTQRNFAW